MSKLVLILYVLATSFALIVLKLGTKDGAPLQLAGNKPTINLNPSTVLGIVLYGVSFLLYMYLISKNDLGYIIPLTTALVYILIFIASYVVFHEVFTVIKIFGIALILAGLIILNLKK